MINPNNELLSAAAAQIQRESEIKRRQKEADKKSRQLFADGVATLREHGDGTGIRTFRRDIIIDQIPVEFCITSYSGVSENPSRIGIAVETQTGFSVNNSYADIEYMKDDNTYGSRFRARRRANIFEVSEYEEIAHGVPDFIRTPTVSDRKEITELEQLDEQTLLRKLRRANLLSGVLKQSGPWIAVGTITGMMLGFTSGQREVAFGSIGILFAGVIGSQVAEIKLNDKSVLIEDEIASRQPSVTS